MVFDNNYHGGSSGSIIASPNIWQQHSADNSRKSLMSVVQFLIVSTCCCNIFNVTFNSICSELDKLYYRINLLLLNVVVVCRSLISVSLHCYLKYTMVSSSIINNYHYNLKIQSSEYNHS